MDEPTINDELLKAAWEKFYNVDLKEKPNTRTYIWDDFRNFLKNYENSEWIVYECDFYSMACGPTTTTLVFVVKAGTVIEEDPDFDAEETERELGNMADEEITNEVLERQIRGLFRGMDKEK